MGRAVGTSAADCPRVVVHQQDVARPLNPPFVYAGKLMAFELCTSRPAKRCTPPIFKGNPKEYYSLAKKVLL